MDFSLKVTENEEKGKQVNRRKTRPKILFQVLTQIKKNLCQEIRKQQAKKSR